MKEILERAKASTPPFFKKLRTAGIVLTAVSTALLTAPFSLPAIAVTVAGYAATVGLVTTSISQLAVEKPKSIQERLTALSSSLRLETKTDKKGTSSKKRKPKKKDYTIE